MAGVDDRPPVVDAHEIDRPPTDVEQQQGGFVRQQVRLGHERGEALGEEQHIFNRDAVFLSLVAKFGRLARVAEQIFSERGLFPAIAGQGQPRRDGDDTLARRAAGLQLLRDGRQRQQVVVVVGGLVALDRLPPATANKKAPAEREHVLAGVRFAVAEGRDAGREGTVSGLDGVVTVVNGNDHVEPHFLFMDFYGVDIVYLQGLGFPAW